MLRHARSSSPASAPADGPHLRALGVITVTSLEEWKRLWAEGDDDEVVPEADVGAAAIRLLGPRLVPPVRTTMSIDQVIISYLAGGAEAESDPDEVFIEEGTEVTTVAEVEATVSDSDEWEQARKEWSDGPVTKEIAPHLLWQLRGLSARKD